MRSGLLAAAVLALACRPDVEDNPWAVADKGEPCKAWHEPKGPTPSRYKPHQGRKEMERRAIALILQCKPVIYEGETCTS